jgi:hypothetical protein
VPLRISEILETSSQVTRWYPLDGGIGFGRIRISLLFRSVETRLPPQLLGWEVGTFETTSDRLVVTGYDHRAKIKLRTGGSTGKIGVRQQRKLEDESGYYFDLTDNPVRLPIKYRYRSPVVFEFHIGGKRGAQAWAVTWLHHLIDNEDSPIDIPIWTTASPSILTQNYITEDNWKTQPGLEDLQEVGRIKFNGRFKAGTDETHEAFIVDNDSRETFETWEACLAEGVRDRQVSPTVPEHVREQHEKSLTEGRDVLKNMDPAEQEKWIAKDGQDWSGAFGEDPMAYMDSRGRKRREPGADKPLHDPIQPSFDDAGDDDDISTSDEDLGIQDADNLENTARPSGETNQTNDTISSTASRTDSIWSEERQNKRTESRKGRGLMQWKPARNVKFAKDEGLIGARKLKNKLTGGLEGRKPGVETGKYNLIRPIWYPAILIIAQKPGPSPINDVYGFHLLRRYRQFTGVLYNNQPTSNEKYLWSTETFRVLGSS